jgi:hypothetical protein
MLVNIINRAKVLKAEAPSNALNIFLHNEFREEEVERHVGDFCMLDDYDVLSAIKSWTLHPDVILSFLCKGIVNRRLLKVRYSGTIIDNNLVKEKKQLVMQNFQVNNEEAGYLVFAGETGNETYSDQDEHINILFKDGSIKDISGVDNALINQTLFGTVKKFYICFPNAGLL